MPQGTEYFALLLFLSGYTPGSDGYSYKFHKDPVTWPEAKERCETEGSSLVMIKNPNTQAYLKATYGHNEFLIGISDVANENEFVYVDGSPVKTFYWAENQPDDLNGKEDCVQMSSGLWVDLPCTYKKSFLCQKG